MADPSGYKTFSPGEVLDAAEGVMAYLMDQVVGVYADSSARATAIGTAAEGQVSYLKDTNLVYLYNGSAWVEVGGGIEWSGSTANGLGTYSSSSEIVAESTATYDGTTLALTTSGGGIQLDGLNSSDANTLDDYEEGTWTVGATADSGTITIAGTQDTGTYIKVGKLVWIQCHSDTSAISSPSGGLAVTGMPFTSYNSGELSGRYNHMHGTLAYCASAFTNGPATQLASNATTVSIFDGSGGTAVANAADKVQVGTSFWLAGCYVANA